jgi:hypothetical protein
MIVSLEAIFLVCVIVSVREDQSDRFGREVAPADQPFVSLREQSISASRINERR